MAAILAFAVQRSGGPPCHGIRPLKNPTPCRPLHNLAPWSLVGLACMSQCPTHEKMHCSRVQHSSPRLGSGAARAGACQAWRGGGCVVVAAAPQAVVRPRAPQDCRPPGWGGWQGVGGVVGLGACRPAGLCGSPCASGCDNVLIMGCFATALSACFRCACFQQAPSPQVWCRYARRRPDMGCMGCHEAFDVHMSAWSFSLLAGLAIGGARAAVVEDVRCHRSGALCRGPLSWGLSGSCSSQLGGSFPQAGQHLVLRPPQHLHCILHVCACSPTGWDWFDMAQLLGTS